MRHLIPSWEIERHRPSAECPCEPVLHDGVATHLVLGDRPTRDRPAGERSGST